MKTKRFFDEMQARALDVRDDGDYYIVSNSTGDIAEISKTEVGKFAIYVEKNQTGFDQYFITKIISICIDYSYTPISERGQIVYAATARTYSKDDNTWPLTFFGLFSSKEEAEVRIEDMRFNETIIDEKVYEIGIDEDELTKVVFSPNRRFKGDEK